MERVSGGHRAPRGREKRGYHDHDTAFVSISGKCGNRPPGGRIPSRKRRRVKRGHTATTNYTNCEEDFDWFTGTGQRTRFLPGQAVSGALRLSDRVLNYVRLFSKFTISTHMHQQVRISDAKLEGGTGLEIKPCQSGPRRAAVVRVSNHTGIVP